MLKGDLNQHPIQLLVNYWEIRPSLMGARLNDLLRKGVTHLATFVPWQAVESDISHTLPRLLQAAADRKMTVSLILTPELGVHYVNSGLPKDLFSKPDNIAKHHKGGPITVGLPPNAFPMPSLSAPEFTKRYHNFLSRIDNLLADLGRNQPQLLEGVTATLTGSFWKYYRAPQTSSGGAFDGPAGDFAGSAAVAFRQRVEQYFAQREFSDPNPAAANRWKTRGVEEVNRRWFYQQCEDVFRNRSTQFVRKKAGNIALSQIELFTPEADPAFVYSNFLQTLTGGRADFARLSSLLDESASRSSYVGENAAPSFVHWTALGGFQSLTDSEKQFLILKSLLLLGGRGGGLLVDEREWFSLSQAFRGRAEALARLISHGDLKLRNRAMYLAPHLWSSGGTLWEELQSRAGAGARLVSSLDLVLAEREARLLVVDPTLIITREVIQKLSAWAKTGRVVVIPKGPLFTESARMELDQVLSGQSPINMDLGVSYRLHSLGEGKLVIFDLPEGSMAAESSSAWQTFLSSLLAVADVQSICGVSDTRLRVIALDKKGGGYGLFIMNSAHRPVAGDLVFQRDVSVSDLASSFANDRGAGQSGSVPANRFALEVPPCGILPVAAEYPLDALEVARSEVQATGVAPAIAQAPREPGSTINHSIKQENGAKWN